MLDVTLVCHSSLDRPSIAYQLCDPKEIEGNTADLFWYGLRPSMGKIGPMSFPLLPAGLLPAADPVRLGA